MSDAPSGNPKRHPRVGEGQVPGPGVSASPRPQPPYAIPQPPRFPGSEVLVGATPKEILGRLCQGDPLDLDARAGERLVERALLLDLERLRLRTLARTAFAAMFYRGSPPLDEWLTACIDRAIQDLLFEDYDEERKGLPPDPRFAPFYEHVARGGRAEPGLGRPMCVAFNILAEDVRRTFHRVIFERRGSESYAHESNLPIETVRAHITEAMAAMLTLKDYPPFNPWLTDDDEDDETNPEGRQDR